MGSRVGRGKELFIKIDKTGVINSANIAKELNSKLFLHVTSKGANHESCFFYLKTKGETENLLKEI